MFLEKEELKSESNVLLLFLINILLYQSEILKSFYISYLGCFYIILKTISLGYKKKEILILNIFGIISILAKDLKLLIFIIIIIYLSKISDRKILNSFKIYFYIGISLFLLIISLANFNLIDTKYFVYSATKIRNGLGFRNPNTPGIYYFILISHFYFFAWKRVTIIHHLLFLTGYFYLYKYAMSRTTMLIGVIQILFIILFRNRLSLKNIKKYYYIIPFLFLILTYLISFFHTKELNKLMTTRPSTWRMNILDNFNLFSILFGNFGKKVNYPLDNGILSIQINFGLIAILIILYLFCDGLRKMDYRYIERIFILVIPFLIYSMSEDMLFSPNFGIFIVFIISKSFSKKINLKRRK